MTEYDIVSDESSREFRECVNSNLQDGWKLYGPAIINVVNGRQVYNQIMIKETP